MTAFWLIVTTYFALGLFWVIIFTIHLLANWDDIGVPEIDGVNYTVKDFIYYWMLPSILGFVCHWIGWPLSIKYYWKKVWK